CTADKKNATILTSDMIPQGVHLNAIGGDCPGKTELDSQLLARANVFVEYEPQTRIEGEIQQMSDTFAVTEFHKVINKQAPGRTSNNELTIFDGVGFASEDFTALVYIKDALVAAGEFELLDLITQQADPRNLFSVLNTADTPSITKQEQVA
ncbi:MAG: ornithine cyclodeaminase, partial [Pseudoalteromonas tetraodonis]